MANRNCAFVTRHKTVGAVEEDRLEDLLAAPHVSFELQQHDLPPGWSTGGVDPARQQGSMLG